MAMMTMVVTMMTMMMTQECRCRPAAHQGRHYSPSSHLPSSSSSELVIAIFRAVTIIVVNNPKTDILTKCVEHIDTIKSGFAKKFDGGKEVSLLVAYSAKSDHLTNQTEHDWWKLKMNDQRRSS